MNRDQITQAEQHAARQLLADGVEFVALRKVIDEWLNTHGMYPSEWRGAPVPKQYVLWLGEESDTPMGEYHTYHEMIAACLDHIEQAQTAS